MTTKASFPTETYTGSDVIQAKPRDDDYEVVLRTRANKSQIDEGDWMLVHKDGQEAFDGIVSSITNRGGSIKVVGIDDQPSYQDVFGVQP